MRKFLTIILLLGFVIHAKSQGSYGLNSVSLSNTVYVAKNGKDSTGIRGRLDKPFASLTNALAAAVAGDTIVVYPGLYSTMNLLKNGVNWYFMEGATNQYNGGADGFYMFDDNNNAITSNISGKGTFIFGTTGNSLGDFSGIFRVRNSHTVLNAEFQDIFITRSIDNSDTILITAVWVADCAYTSFKFNRIEVPTASSDSIGLYWIRGDMDVRCDRVDTQNGWALWGDEDTAYVAEAASSMYVHANTLRSAGGGGCVWYYPDTDKGRLWVTVDEIRAETGNAIFRSSGGYVGANGREGGRFYLTAQKVSNGSANDAAIKYDSTGGHTWMTIQKVSSNFRYIEGGGTLHTNYLNIDHFEQSGTVTNGINITGGEWFIRGQYLEATNQAGIVHSGGQAMISDYSIKSPVPVSLLGAGLRLHNTTLIPSAGKGCIEASSAQTVGIYGTVMATLAKNVNVTLSPAGTLTIDSNVK